MSETIRDDGKTIREGEPAPSGARPEIDSERRLDQYILVQQVGQGGAGSVWKARDSRLDRTVAVKILHSTDPDSVRRFQREAQLAARLRHPNIASIYETGQAQNVHYLVMDFIDGASINKAELPMRRAIEAFAKVCRAIEVAHQARILHRDLKPQNIMVDRAGTPFVTDFGLAKVLSVESSLSVSGAIMGTPAYMPPEQAQGKIKLLDERSDVYSLGATMYAVLANRLPFVGEGVAEVLFQICSKDPDPPRGLNPEIPAPIEAVILKAMRKEREDRYANAGEMARDLESWLAGGTVSAPVAKRRSRLPVGVAIAGILALGAWIATRPPKMTPRNDAIAKAEMPPKVETPKKETSTVPPTDGTTRTKPPNPGKDLPPMPTWRETFDGADDEAAARLLEETPDSERETVRAWIAKRIPAEVWPHEEWRKRKAEAERLVRWCGATRDALPARFDAERAQLEAAIRRFSPVAQYRGKITLKLYILPYADVVSMKVGERWLVKDGAPVDPESATFDKKRLLTPLVITELDLGDYTLVLDLGKGPQTFQFPGKDLVEGGKYAYVGSTDKPGEFKIVESK